MHAQVILHFAGVIEKQANALTTIGARAGKALGATRPRLAMGGAGGTSAMQGLSKFTGAAAQKLPIKVPKPLGMNSALPTAAAPNALTGPSRTPAWLKGSVSGAIGGAGAAGAAVFGASR